MSPNHHQPNHRPRLALIGATFAIAAFLGWASLAEVDEITRATGKTIASSRTQVIQAPDGGIVREILVREGEQVQQGQLLVSLDDSKTRALVQEAEGKLAALKSANARLRAELNGSPLVFPAELNAYPEFINNQRDLYRSRLDTLSSTVSTLRTSLRLTNEELQMSLPLERSGDIAKADILRLRRQLAEQQGQLENARAKYRQEAQAELTKVQEELTSLSQALIDRQAQLERTELHAPTAGVVNLISQTTLGAVLRPGEEIMQILPTGGDLIVEAKLRSADIGFMRIGLPVSVKFDAYDYSIYGVFEGQVTYISSDALTERGPQGVENAYYRMQVHIDQAKFKGERSGVIQVQPGMTCTIEIQTGKRTVLSYLTKPVLKTFSESLTER